MKNISSSLAWLPDTGIKDYNSTQKSYERINITQSFNFFSADGVNIPDIQRCIGI